MEDERPWSIFAIIGFILSFFGLLSILGIVFSAIGIAETSEGKKAGYRLAISGLLIGILIFLFSLISILGILIILSMSGFLNPATIDESIISGQTKITLSGVAIEKTLDYNKSIILEVNGISNKISLANGTSLSMVTLNGIDNNLITCRDKELMVKKSGISNKVIFIDC